MESWNDCQSIIIGKEIAKVRPLGCNNVVLIINYAICLHCDIKCNYYINIHTDGEQWREREHDGRSTSYNYRGGRGGRSRGRGRGRGGSSRGGFRHRPDYEYHAATDYVQVIFFLQSRTQVIIIFYDLLNNDDYFSGNLSDV